MKLNTTVKFCAVSMIVLFSSATQAMTVDQANALINKVKRGNAQALTQLTKAAQGNDGAAEEALGTVCSFGYGVTPDDAKAVYWYKRAADQGVANAQYNLGEAYSIGQGVPKDNTKAAYWYKKIDDQDAEEKREKRVAEQAKSPLKLFGEGLKGATRADLEPAIKKAGLTVHGGQEGNTWWYDKYDVNGQLKGAATLLVGYTGEGRFAVAEYTFPGDMDTGLVGKVIDMVRSKYGDPSSQDGSYDVGNVTAFWEVGDGMEIEVSRGWPDTTTHMDLVDISQNKRMKSELKKQKEQEQAAQAKKQSNAF